MAASYDFVLPPERDNIHPGYFHMLGAQGECVAQGWQEGSVVRGTRSAFGGPGSSLQHTPGDCQLPVTAVPGIHSPLPAAVVVFRMYSRIGKPPIHVRSK